MQPLPPPPGKAGKSREQAQGTTPAAGATIPEESEYVGQSSQTQNGNQNDQSQNQAPKKRKHRGGKKRRNRKQSFAAPSEDGSTITSMRGENPEGANINRLMSAGAPKPFYRLGQTSGQLSSTSLESEALLDHRYVDMNQPVAFSILTSIAAEINH